MLNTNFQKKLKKEGVVLAYLFGSQVSGFTHRESDVDIAVLLKKEIEPQKYFDKSLKLERLFKEIYPQKERQVTILNEASSFLKHEVIKNSELIFCADEKERIKFHMDTIHSYEDTRPLREIQYFYLKKRIKEMAKALS